MGLQQLQDEYSRLKKRLAEIDSEINNSQEEIKKQFIGKCFCFNEGYDKEAYLYNVTDITFGNNRIDIHCQFGYSLHYVDEEYYYDRYETKTYISTEFVFTLYRHYYNENWLTTLNRNLKPISVTAMFDELKRKTNRADLMDLKYLNHVLCE